MSQMLTKPETQPAPEPTHGLPSPRDFPKADVVIFDAGWSLAADELVPVLDEWTLPLILLIPETDEPLGELLAAGFAGMLPRSVDVDRLEAAVLAASAARESSSASSGCV